MKNYLLLLFLLVLNLAHAQQEFQVKFSVEELEEAPVKLIPYPQEVEWDMGTAEFQNLRLVMGPEVEADIQKDPFWVGFETPYRSNRVYTGTPEKGDWEINGGNIWINDKVLEAPDWENPGWTPSRTSGWSTPDQEIPWRKEEL